jgi:Zn-dependent peptidase ImmA (M78 family)
VNCRCALTGEPLLELKRRWRVSVQALLYRARTLGSISESAYKPAMVRVSAAGWRTNEPSDLGEPERPTVLTKALAMVEEAGLLSRDELARQLRLTTELLEGVCAVSSDYSCFVLPFLASLALATSVLAIARH